MFVHLVRMEKDVKQLRNVALVTHVKIMECVKIMVLDLIAHVRQNIPGLDVNMNIMFVMKNDARMVQPVKIIMTVLMIVFVRPVLLDKIVKKILSIVSLHHVHHRQPVLI